jgi:hypothetical protein
MHMRLLRLKTIHHSQPKYGAKQVILTTEQGEGK